MVTHGKTVDFVELGGRAAKIDDAFGYKLVKLVD